MPDTGQSLALFVDFENLALGFAGTRKRFEIEKVLDRLVTKGKILVKKAYADWTRFGDYRRELHENSIELIEIPKRSQVGKNSADIRLCVDALDLCYSKAHLDTFCICSGDSDFSPLVSKLRENGKHVIGVGMKASTSNLLVEGCDEFIYYEDIERTVAASAAAPVVAPSANPLDKKAEALQLVMDTVQALKREGKDVLWGSLVKDTIRRRKPQFDESYYGYKSWSDILEDAQRRGLMALTIDTRSGTYVISNFSPTGGLTPTQAPKSAAPVREFPRDNGGRGAQRTDPAKDAADRAAREQATREAAERASKEQAEREAREATDKAAREASERESADRAAAARAAAEQLPPDHAASIFLSLPAAERSEAETAVLNAEPRAHMPAEEAPAETGAETPDEEVPAEEPASSTEAGSAEPVPAAEGEAPKKGGVRRRGRASVRKPGAGRRVKRRE
ncbi:MAG: NYN domain-containing protein [Planctomycetia bacterium]|nr:NYN domain-containing protein [Planctomycetia bacterium]